MKDGCVDRTASARFARSVDETIETQMFGDITITLRRPKSKLAALAGRIREVLGKDLPDEVAAFYERSDGLHYQATRGGTLIGWGLEASISGLEESFANFRLHRQYRTMRDYENDCETGDIYDQPFCEQLWSDAFDVETKGDLTRLNALKRSKQLVSIPGDSTWLTIDYFDPKRSPYQIGIAEDGCDLSPLDLSFSDFVAHFQRFGAARWYFAFAGRKAERKKNVKFAAEVERNLEGYVTIFPEEVADLIKRAKGSRRKP